MGGEKKLVPMTQSEYISWVADKRARTHDITHQTGGFVLDCIAYEIAQSMS